MPSICTAPQMSGQTIAPLCVRLPLQFGVVSSKRSLECLLGAEVRWAGSGGYDDVVSSGSIDVGLEVQLTFVRYVIDCD